MATWYVVKVGLNYPPNRRAEPGARVNDIPKISLPWLLADGLIEVLAGTPPQQTESSEQMQQTLIQPLPEGEGQEGGGD